MIKQVQVGIIPCFGIKDVLLNSLWNYPLYSCIWRNGFGINVPSKIAYQRFQHIFCRAKDKALNGVKLATGFS